MNGYLLLMLKSKARWICWSLNFNDAV